MTAEKEKQMGEQKNTPYRRILLRVAYDGTNYHGWQLQPGEISIEAVLNRAIGELTGEDIQVIGASRTDAGVHALGNIAVFDTCSRIPAEKFSYALNQRLPEDVIVQESREVSAGFHPRHCHCEKTYEYTILNRRFPLPEYRHTAHFDYGTLDIPAMRQACKAFTGEHDFAAFCSAGAQVQTTVRTIYSLEVEASPLLDGQLVTIRVRGNGFLYNMVRIIAGTLMEVGKGHLNPLQIPGIIASLDRGQAGPTAPARGLKLVEIKILEEEM